MVEQASPPSPPGPGSIPKMRTGIRGLDAILEGGLPAGRTTLVNGGPGTGKTVLAMEFLYRSAAADHPGVFVSFEERAADLRANVAALGMDVSCMEQAGKLKIVHASLPKGVVRSGGFDLKGLLAVLTGHMRELRARCVVLDAIDILLKVFDDTEREREQLHLVHGWLLDQGVTAVLTAKAAPNGQSTYRFMDYLSDCVLFLDQRLVEQVRTRRLIVIKYRGSGFFANEYPYVISSTGMVFMPISAMTLAHETIGGWVSSGIRELDRVLGGGYRQGSRILVCGPSGAGKTSIVCSFAREACRRGEGVLLVSYEQAQDVLIASMAGIGIDLLPAVEAGSLNMITAMPEASGHEQHLLRILTALEAHAPRHVVMDGVSSLERMGSERASFDFLLRLLALCGERGITAILVDQIEASEAESRVGGKAVRSLVDTIMWTQYKDDGRGLRRRLLVVKSRNAAHSLDYHEFTIGQRGIEMRRSAERRPRRQDTKER